MTLTARRFQAAMILQDERVALAYEQHTPTAAHEFRALWWALGEDNPSDRQLEACELVEDIAAAIILERLARLANTDTRPA